MVERTEALGVGVRGVVQGAGVLHRQHDRLLGGALGGGLVMGGEQSVHTHARVVEEAVGGLGLGPRPACLGQLGLGASIAVTREREQALGEAAVAKFGGAELRLGPVGTIGASGAWAPRRSRHCRHTG